MGLPAHARVLIVGGGAVGCSIAYHLAKLGATGVVLLERSTLTSGCTWHAAGLVGQLRSKSNLTRMMQMSAELYAKIGEETGQDVGWHGTGSLRLASSANRWLELKRSATIAKSIGFEMHLLSPREAFAKFPLIDLDGVVGAAYVPSDGYVDPYGLTQAYAKGARAGGVTIVEGVTVTGVTRDGARITRVQTTQGGVEGEIGCEILVNAAGLWARQFGELAGLELPVTVVEHQYLVTEKTDRIPAGLPSLRDPDNNFYLKPEPGAFAIGGWEEGTVSPYGDGRLPIDFGQQLFPQNLERLEKFVVPASTRLPLLNEIGIRTVINGPIPVSADGEPIIGKHPDLDNYHLACGFTAGIAGSGGAGRVLANWIMHGDPGMDLWAFDVRRFSQHHASPAYLHDVGIETYAAYYKIAWPNEERVAARGVRRSPLYDKLAAAGAVYGSKNGWERPNWFRRNGSVDPTHESYDRLIWSDTVGAEHRLVRERVALIDMTSFTKFDVSGPGAFGYLNRLAAANLDKPVGTAVYTQLCNASGGIEADLTIVRLAADRFYVVTGSGFGTRDGGWLNAHAPADGSVRIGDVTSAHAVINLCGPLSRGVLQKVTTDDVSHAGLPYMRAKRIRIGFAPVLALRITYVGELGYELHIPSEYAAYVYDTLLEAGAGSGIGHAGYRAIDSLRIEKGYVYWSADVTPDYNPYEAGLGFAVALGKGDFLGRDALAAIKARGIDRKLCTFVLERPLPVYGGETILKDGVVLGNTTSGNYGFTVGRSIVYGYVPIAHAGATDFEIEAFGERSPATRIERCAYDPERARILI
jgi:4-methylaminobutanoate oxidase (formaldehyde-forming)